MVHRRDQGPLPADLALILIRSLAGDAARVGWSHHAVEKMRERDISIRQALTVLRTGTLATRPFRDEFGEWRYKLVGTAAGRRVEVVVATDCVRALTVVTVI